MKKTFHLYAHRTRLMVEIKSRKRDRLRGRSIELTECILKEIMKNKWLDYIENIFILSFNPNVLKYGLKRCREIKYVINLAESGNSVTAPNKIFQQSLHDLSYLYGVCVMGKNLSTEFVSLAHERKMKVMTYLQRFKTGSIRNEGPCGCDNDR